VQSRFSETYIYFIFVQKLGDIGIVDGKSRALNVEVEQLERRKGRVKWFDYRKGYGFIDQEEGEDIYVNREDLVETETLFKDQSVTYAIGIVGGRTRAVNVKADSVERKMGEVKWFSRGKGYGFIKDAVGDDVFVHQSDLDGVKSLKEGQKVTYETRQADKGPQAIRVRPAK
jgi:CspA family cold shock protein